MTPRHFLFGVALLAAAPAFPAHSDPRFLGSPADVRHVRYEGTLDYEGHYRRPGETRRYESIREVWTDRDDSIRLDWTTRAEGDSAAQPESFLMVNSEIYHRDSPTSPWKRLLGDRRDRAEFQIQAAAPWIYDAFAARTGRELRMPGEAPRSFVTLHAHPRLGDVADSMAFDYSPDSEPVPDRVRLAVYERDANWRLDEAITERDSYMPSESLLAVPASFGTEADEPDSMVADPPVVAIAPGVWSIDMKDVGSRTLVVEFADHLAVIEAAVGSANGERIVDVVKRRWPAKPIRYFLFSHHHPHYMGGVRAFIAEGATIVTTPGNEAAVRAAAGRPFTIQPDRLARAPRAPDVRVFSKRIELADATNRLVAIDIGDRSDHTAEFAIFWLPRQKVLFETEQGWVAVEGKVRASRRAPTLLKTMKEEGIVADRIVQSWPMRDEPASLTRAELDALIAARKR